MRRPPRLLTFAAFALAVSLIAVAPASANPTAFASATQAEEPSSGTTMAIVRPSSGLSVLSTGSIDDLDGVRVDGTLGDAGLLRVEVTPAGLVELEESGLVDRIAVDVPLWVSLSDSTAIVEADAAQASGLDGAGAVVAVIDSGVDTSHPAFAGRVVGEACFISRVGGTCATGGTTSTAAGSAAPCGFSDNVCLHGTHVAAIAVSGSAPIEGVATGAGLLAIRVMGDSPTMSSVDVFDAMNHVLSLVRGGMNIAAVNISLGGSPDACSDEGAVATWHDITALLNAEGVAVVVASGNEADLFFPIVDVAFPACVDNMIAVGATERSLAAGLAPGSDPEVADFTQYGGTGLDLVAPGVGIESAWSEGGTHVESGTSMAAPHIAGAFAVLKSTQSGAWTPERFMELLRTTGSMVERHTFDPSDRHDRYPELRLTDALAFSPFSDASGGYWVAAADWAKYTGVSAGFGDNRYDPDGTLPRSQAVTLLWRLMGSPEPAGANEFNDVPNGEFYTKAVTWAAEEGITAGSSPGFFSPNDTVTRAQMATFLWRLVGEPTGAPNAGFTDVPAGEFYEQAVNWMASTGITLGTSPTTFSPDQTINRAQMITFIHRLVNNQDAWNSAAELSSFVMF